MLKVCIISKGYLAVNIAEYLEKIFSDVIIEFITRDNIDVLKSNQYDYLINAAGVSGDYRTKLIETVESNIDLNIYILKYAQIKFSYIFLSSSRIYGFSENENDIFNENSFSSYNNLKMDYIYDGSKKLSESILYNFSKNCKYNIGILRLSNVYGRFDVLDDTTLIKKIVRYKKDGIKELYVNENLDSTKDYIYIDDAVEMIVQVMLSLKKTDVYNIAFGKSYSLRDISSNLNINIIGNCEKICKFSNVSIEKVVNTFELKPKYDFKDGLNKIFQELNNGYN